MTKNTIPLPYQHFLDLFPILALRNQERTKESRPPARNLAVRTGCLHHFQRGFYVAREVNAFRGIYSDVRLTRVEQVLLEQMRKHPVHFV